MKTTRIISQGQLGLTLVEVLVVLVCIALLAALLLPIEARVQSKGLLANCQNNLRQIGLEYRGWQTTAAGAVPPRASLFNSAGDRWPTGTNVIAGLKSATNYFYNPKFLICPADTRIPAASFASLTPTNLSYFFGVGIDETIPAMWLTGDRNLVTNGVPVVPGLVQITGKDTVTWSATMHRGTGNIGLADGSVMQADSASYKNVMAYVVTNQPGFTNRLIVP